VRSAIKLERAPDEHDEGIGCRHSAKGYAISRVRAVENAHRFERQRSGRERYLRTSQKPALATSMSRLASTETQGRRAILPQSKRCIRCADKKLSGGLADHHGVVGKNAAGSPPEAGGHRRFPGAAVADKGNGTTVVLTALACMTHSPVNESSRGMI